MGSLSNTIGLGAFASSRGGGVGDGSRGVGSLTSSGGGEGSFCLGVAFCFGKD